MAHHKRKGPKSTRAGCLLCKPHKRQGSPNKKCTRHGTMRRAFAGTDGRRVKDILRKGP